MSMNPTGDERGMTLDDILAVFALDFEQVLVMQYVAPQPMRLSQVLDELLAEWEHPAPSFYSARDEEEVMSGVRGASVYGPDENSRGEWVGHEVDGICRGECDSHGV